jgi:hypothetical protein
MRPKALLDPIAHVSVIENILKGGYKKFQKLQNRPWLAGSMQEGHSLGGHIHFGSTCDEYLDLKLTALDKLLAPVVMMLENEESAKQRRGTEYGKLASHGGSFKETNRGYKTRHNQSKPLHHGGFEYRPLPSWLVSKSVANSIMALAKVICFQAHNKKLHRHLWVQLKFVPFSTKFYNSFMGCDKKFFAPMIPTIYRIVRSFKLFPQYSQYIDHAFQLIKQGRNWEEKLDLKKRWNIIPSIRQTQKSGSLYTLNDAWDLNVNLKLKPKSKRIILSLDEDEEESAPKWAGSVGKIVSWGDRSDD